MKDVYRKSYTNKPISQVQKSGGRSGEAARVFRNPRDF